MYIYIATKHAVILTEHVQNLKYFDQYFNIKCNNIFLNIYFFPYVSSICKHLYKDMKLTKNEKNISLFDLQVISSL